MEFPKGRSGSSSLWSTMRFKPRGRYNLIWREKSSVNSALFCSAIGGNHKRSDLPLASTTNAREKPGHIPRCRSSAPAEREPLPLEHSSDIEGPKPSLPQIQRTVVLGSAASCLRKATSGSEEIRGRRIGKILKAEESTYCPSSILDYSTNLKSIISSSLLSCHPQRSP